MAVTDGDVFLAERTGIVGKVTAEQLKDYTQAGGGGGSVYSFMKRSSTSTASVASRVTLPLQTEGESFGSDVSWSSANNTRLVAQVNGVYRMGAAVAVRSASQRAQSVLEVLKNGVGTGVFRGSCYIRNSGTAWDFWVIEMSVEPFNLLAGEYLEIDVVRTSGAAANYAAGGSGALNIRGESSLVWMERVA